MRVRVRVRVRALRLTTPEKQSLALALALALSLTLASAEKQLEVCAEVEQRELWLRRRHREAARLGRHVGRERERLLVHRRVATEAKRGGQPRGTVEIEEEIELRPHLG